MASDGGGLPPQEPPPGLDPDPGPAPDDDMPVVCISHVGLGIAHHVFCFPPSIVCLGGGLLMAFLVHVCAYQGVVSVRGLFVFQVANAASHFPSFVYVLENIFACRLDTCLPRIIGVLLRCDFFTSRAFWFLPRRCDCGCVICFMLPWLAWFALVLMFSKVFFAFRLG